MDWSRTAAALSFNRLLHNISEIGADLAGPSTVTKLLRQMTFNLTAGFTAIIAANVAIRVHPDYDPFLCSAYIGESFHMLFYSRLMGQLHRMFKKRKTQRHLQLEYDMVEAPDVARLSRSKGKGAWIPKKLDG